MKQPAPMMEGLYGGIMGAVFVMAFVVIVGGGFREGKLLNFWGGRNARELRWSLEPIKFSFTMLTWVVFGIPFVIGGGWLVYNVWTPMWSLPLAIVGPLVGAWKVYVGRGIVAKPSDVEVVLDHAARGQREEAELTLAGIGDGPPKYVLATVARVSGGAATFDYRASAVVTTSELMKAFDGAYAKEMKLANRRALPMLCVLAPVVFFFVRIPPGDAQGIRNCCFAALLSFGLALVVRYYALRSLRSVRAQAVERFAK